MNLFVWTLFRDFTFGFSTGSLHFSLLIHSVLRFLLFFEAHYFFLLNSHSLLTFLLFFEAHYLNSYSFSKLVIFSYVHVHFQSYIVCSYYKVHKHYYYGHVPRSWSCFCILFSSRGSLSQHTNGRMTNIFWIFVILPRPNFPPTTSARDHPPVILSKFPPTPPPRDHSPVIMDKLSQCASGTRWSLWSLFLNYNHWLNLSTQAGAFGPSLCVCGV